MATKSEKVLVPVLFIIGLVLFVAVVVYFSNNPVPQTQQHLGCAQDSLRLELIAPATVYSDSFEWDTLFGPTQEMAQLQAGTSVCVIAHDDFNPEYAQVVFPDPTGTGQEDQFVRGWVELETLPEEARTARLSIHDPWEHPLP